jgi:hypothetical protein
MRFPLTRVCHTLTCSPYLNGIGRSPLPEHEAGSLGNFLGSLSPFPQNGPQARQKHYEWMSESFTGRVFAHGDNGDKCPQRRQRRQVSFHKGTT